MKTKLDNLVRKIIKARDNYCIVCGEYKPLVVGHYMKRRHLNTRWSVINCNGICLDCNREDNSEDTVYREKLIEMYGLEVIDNLEFSARQNAVFFDCDLKDIEKELKKILKEIENG